MFVNAHRASYIAFNEKFLLPLDISHCCHEKLCVNPEHVSHEEHEVNMDREDCKEFKKCIGHGNYKPCVFER